jgi:SAM-dependent methyltransferase
MTGRNRLLNLKARTEAHALEMEESRARFARLEHDGPARAIVVDQLFQTPPDIARRMVDQLPDLSDAARILEPSAGLGRLYRAIRDRYSRQRLTLVEIAPKCCAELYEMSAGDEIELLQRDFLTVELPEFDAVVMNPPFRRGLDIRHIMRAYHLLKPGGVMVALCFDGVKQNKALRDWSDTWEPIPAGAFKESGTMAGCVMLTKTKS